MILLAGLVLGGLAWSNIPVQLMPSGFDYPYLWVWMPYPASTPQENERLLLRPAEDAMETVPGIRSISSKAATDNVQLEIEFDQDVDMNDAWNGLVERLERARAEFPADFKDYYVYKYNPADEPILWAAITLPKTEEDPAWVIESRIVKRLERVPGVARVEFNGVNESRVYVDFSRELIERHHVALYEVMEKLGSDNFTMPSGQVGRDGRRVLVRSLATLGSVEELAAMPIGHGLKLSDIAEVVRGIPLSTSIHRVNGEDAASIDVYKESGANTVEVCRRLQLAIDELGQDPRLKHFKVHRFFDQGELIQESVDNLLGSALQGGALAILVLVFFLRRLPITVVIALSGPVSLLVAVIIAWLQGGSINILSLMGLMLAVGMTVDNAIVVVESIYRRRELGEDAITAARRGTAEVAMAVFSSTLVSVVVFLPIVLMSDDAQFSFFMGQIGIPVCWALIGSLGVAMVFVPLATVAFIGGAPPAELRVVAWVTDRYVDILAATLRHRSTAALVALVLLASIAFPLGQIGRSDQAEGGIIDFVISLEFPASFSTREIDEALGVYEKMVMGKAEEWRIRAVRARRWGSGRRGFVMAFTEKRERGDVTKEAIEEALPDLLPEVPGVDAWVGWRRNESSGSAMTLRLYGDDSEVLADLGVQVADRLRDLPGILAVEVETDEGGADELHVRVDRQRASRYGVDPTVLGRTVAFAFRGTQLRDLVIDGRDVPSQAGYRLEDRSDAARLAAFPVWSPLGQVALATVADLTFTRGYGTIHREDRKTSLGVTVTFAGDDLLRGAESVRGAFSELQLPRGYGWTQGDRLDDLDRQDRARSFALIMSIAFVFLLMGILFNSFWTPLAVLFSIPFAFIGVYWLLWATGTTFEMMAGIGLVILVGIVVSNAIVLLDRVEHRRLEGLTRTEALLEAGRERIRPIVMTAITTIVGLIPMALGDSAIVGTPYYPLGRAVIGGLMSSTLLTLLLVPLFYSLLDDLRVAFSRAVRGPAAGAMISPPD